MLTAPKLAAVPTSYHRRHHSAISKEEMPKVKSRENDRIVNELLSMHRIFALYERRH